MLISRGPKLGGLLMILECDLVFFRREEPKVIKDKPPQASDQKSPNPNDKS
jgi:hypothetical protein